MGLVKVSFGAGGVRLRERLIPLRIREGDPPLVVLLNQDFEAAVQLRKRRLGVEQILMRYGGIGYPTTDQGKGRNDESDDDRCDSAAR